MIRGQSGQVIGAQMVSATTGGAFVGAVTVYVTVDGGVQAIGTVGAGVCTAEGNGYYTYTPSASETNGLLLAYTFIGAGAIPATIQVATVTAAQTAAISTATGSGVVPASQICTDALTEIRVARAGDVVSPDDMTFAFNKLLRLIDRWNAEANASFTTVFTAYTPIPLHQPHTLGPTGDWVVAQRPLQIAGANLILPATGNSGPIRVPLAVRDDQWWLNNTTQGIATSIPTDLYYSPDWPNGSVYLWPIPTMTYQIELMTDGLFGVLLLTTAFWMPYGYRDAITLTLAEECAAAFGQAAAASTIQSAREARALIFGRNQHAPNIRTRDAGMPSGGSFRGRFNYLTGQVD